VTKKYVDENGEYCVDIEAHGVTKEGRYHSATATVILLKGAQDFAG